MTVFPRKLSRPCDDFVEAPTRDVEPFERHAHLARRHVGGHSHPPDLRLVEGCVVEHDGRIVAPELEGHPRQIGCGHLHDRLASADAAGEAHVLDARVADHDRPDHGIGSCHDVENARRERESDVAQRSHDRHRRRRRRLDHDGVAGHERVREARAENRERPVEREDDRDDAQRDVGDRRRERRPREYLVVVEARRHGRRLVEPADQDERVDRRLEPGLAVLADEQLRALVGVALEPCERGERELHALGRR